MQPLHCCFLPIRLCSHVDGCSLRFVCCSVDRRIVHGFVGVFDWYWSSMLQEPCLLFSDLDTPFASLVNLQRCDFFKSTVLHMQPRTRVVWIQYNNIFIGRWLVVLFNLFGTTVFGRCKNVKATDNRDLKSRYNVSAACSV